MLMVSVFHRLVGNFWLYGYVIINIIIIKQTYKAQFTKIQCAGIKKALKK